MSEWDRPDEDEARFLNLRSRIVEFIDCVANMKTSALVLSEFAKELKRKIEADRTSMRPWRIEGRDILDADGQTIMNIDAAFISDADAEFIVRQANKEAT